MRISFESFAIGLNSFGRVQPDPQWSIRPHSHLNHEIHFVTEGRGCNLLERGELDFYPDIVYVAPPHEIHEQHSDKTMPLGLYYALFVLEMPERREPFPRIYAPHRFLASDLASIQRRMGESSVSGRMAAFLQLGELICRAIEPYLEPAPLVRGREEPQPPMVKANDVLAKAIAYIQNRFLHNPSVQEVAGAVHVSERHLSRLFREQLGVSAHEVTQRERFQWAAAELAHSASPVQEIAERLGFTSMAYFSQWFKRFTGLAPTEYRGKRARLERR
ncbi:helix-turn-helix transcriptional regulator [Paenibacillus cymbidii]|uniref:helix-turn-helix transcriptional regulator n=1 Tax=Paenibacillus cymbidii TaxID=1639034 RepID=UPI0010806BC9|nr:AraC family transcriptional regulator [Paenibacillus cymbidii]